MAIAKQREVESEITLIWVENTSLIELKRFEEERTNMQKYLGEAVKSIQDSGIKARSEILVGDPASSLIDFVKTNPTQATGIK